LRERRRGGHGFRGRRDPRRHGARDRYVRPVRGGGDGVESLTTTEQGTRQMTSDRSARQDIRGLAEPDVTDPKTAVVTGDTAELDAAELSTRQINLELRRLVDREGVTKVTVRNPRVKHALGVGLLARCQIDGPEIH